MLQKKKKCRDCLASIRMNSEPPACAIIFGVVSLFLCNLQKNFGVFSNF